MPTLGRLRRECCLKFEVSLGCDVPKEENVNLRLGNVAQLVKYLLVVHRGLV